MRRTQRLISSREFQEWQEYYKQAPFGDDWEQAAKLLTATFQVWTKKKLDWRKFVPQYGSAGKTPEQLEAMLMSFGRRHNAAVASQERKPTKGK